MNLKKDAAAGGIGQALQFPGCANIQPLHYVNGLARALTQKYGGRIFENSRVTKMNGKHVRRHRPLALWPMQAKRDCEADVLLSGSWHSGICMHSCPRKLCCPDEAGRRPQSPAVGRVVSALRAGMRMCVQVHVKEGFKVDADHVVMATRSPVHHNLIVHSRQEPFKTYIVALKVPKVRATHLLPQTSTIVLQHFVHAFSERPDLIS